MDLDKHNGEVCIGEGIEFTNENVSIFEYLTKTILILDSADDIIKHYSSVSDIRIEWIDLLNYTRNIH
jgi:hypothetical protein